MLMGSVAEEVVRKAKCPVLTVKAAAPKPPKAGAK
jgi:nucleotide-binding universal stress UspA family protein